MYIIFYKNCANAREQVECNRWGFLWDMRLEFLKFNPLGIARFLIHNIKTYVQNVTAFEKNFL